MNTRSPVASQAKPPLTPRGNGGNSSSRASSTQRSQRVATALSKANDLQRLRRSYDTWRAFLRDRHQQVHMKRCAVALKHSNNRQQYTRLFVRWLAAAQQSASQEAKELYEIPKEFPLRRKKDVLSLVSRYFAKWRRHLREQRQRTCTNVAMLARVNEDRLRARAFAAWRTYQQQCREDLFEARFQESEQHIEKLTAQLKSREKEVALLQATVEEATGALNGNPTKAKGSAPDGESAADSLTRTKALASALHGALGDAVQSDAAGSQAAPAAAAPESLAARLRSLEVSLTESKAEAAQAKAEAERAKAEAERAKAEAEDFHQLVAALMQMADNARGAGTELANESTGGPSAQGAARSPSNASSSKGNPRDGTSVPSSGRSGRPPSRTGSPASPEHLFASAKANAEQVAKQLEQKHDNHVAPHVVNELARLMAAEQKNQADLERRATEVAGLREAATRAIDSLGGLKDKKDPVFVDNPGETVAQSAKRSGIISGMLSELCEDLVVVLVLTSLWSKDGASEKVSDSLERLWRTLEQATKDCVLERETASEVMSVVAGAAELLGGGIADSSARSEELVRTAKATARVLREAKRLPLPQQLLDCCLELEGAKVKEIKGADAQRQRLEDTLATAKADLTAAQEDALKTEEALRKVSDDLVASERQLMETQKQVDRAEEELHHTAEKLADAERELAESKKALDESSARATELNGVFDGLADFVCSPHSAEAREVAGQAATVADRWGLDGPARCIRLLDHLNVRLQDALQGLPESVAAEYLVAGPNASLEDAVSALCGWRDELLRDMQEAILINTSGEAIAAFLRDVLRDVIHRLAQMRESVGDEEAAGQCTKLSLALDPASAPRPLIRGDPTHYVEYILQLEGTDELSKRAVQDHFATGGVLGRAHGVPEAAAMAAEEGQADSGGGPSTWDVIVDLHENLAGLIESSAKQSDFLVSERGANERLEGDNMILRESLEAAQRALRHWCDVEVERRDPSSAGDALVTGFDAEVDAVVAGLQQLKELADEEAASLGLDGVNGEAAAEGGNGTAGAIHDIPSLIAAVAKMRSRLVQLQHSAMDGIAALGGHSYRLPHSGSDATGAGGGQPQSIAERLAAICRETGASLEEAKQILGVGAGDDRPLTLRDILPSIQDRIQELEEVKRETEAFVYGLDSAFNDEINSLNSSMTSTSRAGKSLKAKKKPLPALEGSPTLLMSMVHKEFAPLTASSATHMSTAGLSPQARIQAIRSHALGKIDEVQDLRMACRAAINVLDGSYVEGQKPPAYGDALVPLLLSQIEDIKQCLPQCEEVLNADGRRASVGRKDGVATKLATLASTVESLRMERDGLRDELAGKSRQNQILLDDMTHQADEFDEAAEELQDRTAQLVQESAALKASETSLTAKLQSAEAQCKELDEEAQRLDDAVKELSERLADEAVVNDELTQRVAQRQHDNNVLTSALAKALLDLAPPPPEPSAGGRYDSNSDTQRTDGDDIDDTGANADQSAALIPRSLAEMEPYLLQMLAVDEGAPLSRFVSDQVAAIRHYGKGALASQQHLVQDLREELQAVRERLDSAWVTELQPRCVQLLAGAEEEAERLRLENDMLRPRAVEREALLKQNIALREQLADAEADVAAAEQEAQRHRDANSELRKALSEAQVEQVIRSISTNHPADAVNGGGGDDGLLGPLNIADLERRMIHGATTLTMEAIDAMGGENMAHAFGDVAARTVGLFHGMERCLQDMQEAYYGYKQSQNPHVLATAVEDGVVELERLSSAADELWSKVPVLFRVPYRSRR